MVKIGSKTMVNSQKCSTLVELGRKRGIESPDRLAYSFLLDGERETAELTYGTLEARARAIAATLQATLNPGDRGLLLFSPGIDYIVSFFGCLYAGVIAVPAYPPKPNQSLNRVEAIIADALPSVILTTQSIQENAEKQLSDSPRFSTLRWITPGLIHTDPCEWREPVLTSESIAYLQYTSGSTADPKGVMLTHGNLLNNLGLIYEHFGHTHLSKGVIWLPPYHDMGLIGGILQPLYGGFPVTLMSPYAFLQRPMRWLRAISRTRATTSGGPNFAYDLCARRATPEQLAQLDLSSWEVAFCGAEPIRHETFERFARAFEPYGFRRKAFYPCYGLAEATLFVSGGVRGIEPTVRAFDSEALKQNRAVASASDEETTILVGCGHEGSGQQTTLVDQHSGAPCVAGGVGEIWVAGPSVARGYWKRPKETAHTFRARVPQHGGEPFLRTGDTGFWHGGVLFVTGRLKDLIVIRGRNHHPHDIELSVERSHPALRPGCGAAFSVDVAGEEKLVVVHEVERKNLCSLLKDEIFVAMREAIATQHDLSAHALVLVKQGSIPKTASGKIRRRTCREEFVKNKLKTVAIWIYGVPESPLPTPHTSSMIDIHKLRDWLVCQISGQLKVSPDRIDPREPFTSYGLDSLAMVTLSGELERKLGRSFAPNFFAECLTIDRLCARLSGETLPPTPATELNDDVPPEYCSIALFPEYLRLKQLMETVEIRSGGNPYFKVNEGITSSTTHVAGQECINFSAYNYLALATDPRVGQATKMAVDEWGTSVSASRVASGERPFHRELETEICRMVGTEDAVVYIGGHTANVTTISSLFRAEDLIVFDAHTHNSVMQGCALSGARSLPFPHNDWEALDGLLREQRRRYKRVLIVLEGVYSMDGDIPDLPRFIDVKKRHKAFLMIDEAHSIGVLGRHGRGLGEHFAVAPKDVDLWMGTLSKAFASCGGYIAASRPTVEYLKYCASGFVYSVGISPPNAVSALTAIRLLKAEPERVERLHDRSRLFQELLRARGFVSSASKDSPVVPLIVGDSFSCIKLSRALLEHGINVQPIIYPAVEANAARLRFFINCSHTPEQIRFTVGAVAAEMARLRGNETVAAETGAAAGA
jgi:8-amino-7-oxononanoate synthase